jgi:hypothetical protein
MVKAKDFELVKKESIWKLPHLKFPHSFRATLANLSKEVCNAFVIADSSMHRILPILQQVPKHVQGTELNEYRVIMAV